MTHTPDVLDLDDRLGPLLLRGLGGGAVAGAVSGALSVVPLVAWNGPAAAWVVYLPLAAIPGALVGVVLGLVGAVVLRCTRPATRARAGEIGALVGLLGVGWLAFVVPLFGVWALVLAVVSGALVAPRVSARRNGAGAATGTASPGSSRAPGR